MSEKRPSALLVVHRILITAAIVLGGLLVVWGIVHGLVRHEPGALYVMGLGLVVLPLGAIYLRKIRRDPPIQ
jgi:hypothetical protein